MIEIKFNVGDIVEVKENGGKNYFGKIIEIFKIEDSANKECIGNTLYTVKPFGEFMKKIIVEAENIVSAYSMYYCEIN